MSLFTECKDALKDDFQLVEDAEALFNILKKYPMHFNNIMWNIIMDFKDYDDYSGLIKDLSTELNEEYYVFADDNDIPLFSSTLKSIIENIYDIMALSPKIFIFNQSHILEPLFPTYTIRVSGIDFSKVKNYR